MILWKIYYGDLTAFSSRDGGPERAPALDVQAIAVADPWVGRFIYSQRDFYWYDNGQWFGADIFGLWDYLARPGWKRVLFGRSLPRAQFEAVMKLAVEDPDLPTKSAWDERETRP